MNCKNRHIRKVRVPWARTLFAGAVALCLGAAPQAVAQVAAYSFSRSVGTYTDITGGMVLGTSNSGSTVAYVSGTSSETTGSGNGHPNFIRVGPGYPIGFNFGFNGDVFDRIGIAPQGWISLGKSSNGATAVYCHGGGFGSSTAPLSYNVAATGTNVPPPDRLNRIAGLAISDLMQSNAADFGELRLETIGSTPNRVCVIQYTNFRTSNFFPGSPNRISFQIRLNEVDNSAEVIYKDPSTGWLASTSLSAQVGLRGATGTLNATDFNRVACSYNSTLGMYDWTTLVPVTTNNTAAANYCYVNVPAAVVQPAAGTTLRWSPPTCWAPTNVVLSSIEDDEVTMTWTNGVGGGVYEYSINTTNSATAGTPITGGSAGSSPMVATGLTPNTQYYAFIRQNCGGGDVSSWVPLPNRGVVVGSSVAVNAFTTAPACGTAFDKSYPFIGGGGPIEGTWTVCPENVGDVANVTFSTFSVTSGNTALYVYDGPTTASPLISSGQPGQATPANLAGGFYGTAVPGPFMSQTNGCLTFRYASAGGGDSWTSSLVCEPAPTCFPPSGVAVTPGVPAISLGVALTSPASQAQYRIVASGSPASASALAVGVISTWPTTISAPALLGSTAYTMFVRAICAPGDTSGWSLSTNFTTNPGCGAPINYTNAGATYPFDRVNTICPNSPGDVVSLSSSPFTFNSFGGDVTLYVFDGPTTASPLISSHLPGISGFTSGGYYLNPSTTPAFTSTHSGGCLTTRLRANGGGSYTGTWTPSVTCAPAPACATPHGVSATNIQQTGATINWTGAGSNYIIEYGAQGFAPGTGATAGAGTVVSNVASGHSLSTLTGATVYDVYVRQVCAGPVYSANSFRVRFTTSMDCSVATAISCNGTATQSLNSGAGNASYKVANYTNAPCLNTQGTDGSEYLYRFNAALAGNYRVNVTGATTTGRVAFLVAPVSGGCSPGQFSCVGVTGSSVSWPYPGITGAFDFTIATPGDYYLMLEEMGSPTGSITFQVLCPGIPPCITAPTFPLDGVSLAANSNVPVGFSTTPIVFSWVAAYGATAYDIYFQGALVQADYTGTTISSASYTPANIAALYGVGSVITWRVVPKNSFGTAPCPTNYTFRIGGDGTTNALSLTSGVASAGSNRATYGYTNQNTAAGYWGRDVHYTFTTSACASGANFELCMGNFVDQNYPIYEIRRVADNVQVGSSLGTLSPPSCRSLSLTSTAIAPNTAYYLIVDAYGGQFEYTIKYTEVLSTTDTDGDGLLDCADGCPETPGEEGSPCYAGPLFGSAVVNGDCECEGQDPVACSNTLTLEFQTDGNPSQTTWELVEQGTNFVTQTGGPLPAPNGVMTMNTCLPDGCFYLRVLDSAGDGMTSGGYILRTQGTNLRIIDNRNNFSSGSVSAISGNQGFCLPIGTDRTIFTSCDKLDWVTGKFIVASANAAVSGQFGVTNSTSGYEFWFFDPNGSYSFRRFRNHATSDGTGTGATRACHFRINGWTNTVSTPHLPANTLLNVRVRGRVAGSNLEFGPACLFKIDAALAACPRVSLQDNPADSDYSCGVSRTFGGANSASNKLVAAAPQIIPAVASTSVRYQFRFRIPGEYPAAGSCIVRPIQTSPTLYLNWTSGERLKCNTQYDVDMRVSKDGGATWCVANGAATCDSPASIQLWGKVCKVNITSSSYCPANGQGGASNLAVENTGDLTMYPNPNRGDQLFINLNAVEAGVNTVNVDIFDLTGKKVTARTIAVQDGTVKTALELNGDLSNGMYLVNITAGSKAYTERLVIQH